LEGKLSNRLAPPPPQVRQFVEVSDGHTSRLSREQKGRLVATCWTAQKFRQFDDPKPGYVADWPRPRGGRSA